MIEHFGHDPDGWSLWRGRKVVRIIVLALAGVATTVVFAAVFGWLVQVLWNWLMPSIFGLKTITYWQGFGILLLAKMLFGGFSSSHRYRNGRWGRRFREHVHGVEPEGESDPDEGPTPGDRGRWPLFRQFWREEGRAAFEAYVQKRKSPGEK